MATTTPVQRLMFRWRIAQFFEILWWKNYLHNKDKSAYLAWKTDYWRQFLQKSGIQLPPGAPVLDAGCGPAGIFTILENHPVDAVDPLLAQYETSLPHFSRADWPHVRFVAATLEAFEPESRTYPVVFCLNAINHVIDIDQCLDKLTNLTAPKGTLALSIDAHNYSFLKVLFRLLPGDILHPHQYDLAEYQTMLTRRGFTLTRTVLVKKEGIFNYYLLVGEKG